VLDDRGTTSIPPRKATNAATSKPRVIAERCQLAPGHSPSTIEGRISAMMTSAPAT